MLPIVICNWWDWGKKDGAQASVLGALSSRKGVVKRKEEEKGEVDEEDGRKGGGWGGNRRWRRKKGLFSYLQKELE